MNHKYAGTNEIAKKMTKGMALARGLTLSESEKLANTDDRIVAFTKHHRVQMTAFITYIEGTASASSSSWPLYVRADLLDTSWTVGSHLEIGNPNDDVPMPSNI